MPSCTSLATSPILIRIVSLVTGIPTLFYVQDDAKLYKSNEISNLIVGLGLGLKGEELGQLRYGKVRLWQSWREGWRQG